MRGLAFAAALLAAGPAPARDLDRAQPAPISEPCPEKGQGFVRVPGSTNCIRLSGRATGGIDMRAGAGGTAVAPVAAGRFAIDNRTDTDLGEVRTYVRIGNGRR